MKWRRSVLAKLCWTSTVIRRQKNKLNESRDKYEYMLRLDMPIKDIVVKKRTCLALSIVDAYPLFHLDTLSQRKRGTTGSNA